MVAAHGAGIRAVDNVHRRMVIDFKQPGLQVLVNEDVEAEDLVHLGLVLGLLLGVRILRVQCHLHEVSHQ